MNTKELVNAYESYLGRLLAEDEIKWIFESLKADPGFSERLLQRISQRR